MVYTAEYASPLGMITLACDGEAITGLWFNGQKHFGSILPLETLRQEHPLFAKARRWLDIYFSGREPGFLPPLRYDSTPFRKLVCDILAEGNAVVSCGGGVVVREENVRNMKSKGTIVYLTATPETIFERVKNSTDRPILNGNMNVEYIRGLMDKRKDLYKGACDIDIATDGKTKEEICDEIISKLQKKE